MMVPVPSKGNYDWFQFLSDDNQDPLIIVMHPATRKSIRPELMNEEAYSDLLASLQIAHKAKVFHCDVRSSNCLHFPGGDRL